MMTPVRMRLRVAIPVLVFAALLSLLLGADAAVAKPTFGSFAPVGGSTVTTQFPVLSAMATDPQRRSMYSATMRVDDIDVPFTITQSGGRAYFSYKPVQPLAEGVHRVYVAITDSYNQRGYATWSFYVSVAPVLSSPQPAAGSVVGTRAPEIAATLVNPGVSPECAATIDGIPAPAAYDSITGKVRVTDVPALSDEDTHTVTLNVTTSTGRMTTLTWSFGIRVYPDMIESPCADCHPGDPLPPHPMADCEACHFTPGPIGDCGSCHGWGTHPAEFVVRVSCDTCHNPSWPSIPSHSGDVRTSHRGTLTPSCRECHSVTLTTEHYRRKDDTGGQLTCTACHGASASAEVSSAVAAGDRSCGTCHGAAVEHEQFHETGLDAQCESCHQSSLTAEHLQNAKTQETLKTCETCHDVTQGRAYYALRYDDVQCAACHSAAHELPLAMRTPSDVPLYPAFQWGGVQEASLWTGDHWMPYDFSAFGGKYVVSGRTTTVTGTQVWDYYRSELAARGWALSSAPSGSTAEYFEARFTKGQRSLLIRFYGGENHDQGSSSAGYACDVIYH